MSASRSHATVTWFSENKGYGYLSMDDGTPVFVQHTAVEGQDFARLASGQSVSFVLTDDGRGPAAAHVRTEDDGWDDRTSRIS